jgi:G3E family GTPase
MPSVPLQLVSGFLGSGKTTFLKNYLQKFSGDRKIGIIQNEYSAINVDSTDLKQSNADYEILEINNGSVFCVCLLGSFIDSLAAFIDQIKPDELIIEASGMSDPLSIGQIIHSPKLKQKVYLDRVWTLVDAVNFKKITKLQSRVNHQIRLADTIILNKIDLVENIDYELTELLKKINPFADIIPSKFAQIEFGPKPRGMKFIHPFEKAENDRPDLQSQVIRTTRKISDDNLILFVKEIQEYCIRSKGLINLISGSRVFLQMSFSQYTIKEVDPIALPTEFVVIGNIPESISFQKLFDTFCTK